MATRVDGATGGFSPAAWIAGLVARPGFQRIAARMPLSRGIARREGAALFDLLQGFAKSQVLLALVELDLLRRLLRGPAAPADLAPGSGLTPERMAILLQAGAAIGLLRRRRDGRFRLSRRGAALLGVPGLELMIRHNAVFYRDMSDPVAVLAGSRETELARFWPYVLGATGDVPPETAAAYSELMAQSQALVAEDTLDMVPLRGVRHLLDVGGGAGAFVAAVAARYPRMQLGLFDLPAVLPAAEARLAAANLSARVTCHAGSFRRDPLPAGADAISLVRVLYDHDDATVAALLGAVFAALPAGGRLIVAEPMAGGAVPEPAGDVYFAFYTMAMGTGRARSAARIADMCRAAGFADVQIPRARRPYITGALTCVKPA